MSFNPKKISQANHKLKFTIHIQKPNSQNKLTKQTQQINKLMKQIHKSTNSRKQIHKTNPPNNFTKQTHKMNSQNKFTKAHKTNSQKTLAKHKYTKTDSSNCMLHIIRDPQPKKTTELCAPWARPGARVRFDVARPGRAPGRAYGLTLRAKLCCFLRLWVT